MADTNAVPEPSSFPVWPAGIAVGMLIVVLVNFAFVWVAVAHAPTVEPSYTGASHR